MASNPDLQPGQGGSWYSVLYPDFSSSSSSREEFPLIVEASNLQLTSQLPQGEQRGVQENLAPLGSSKCH